MRSFRIACFFILLSLLLQPASGADRFKRVAVMPFENTTREKALDWLGGGIAETLTTELGHIPEFTLVERTRLNDALKEIKLGQSAAVDPATAQRMGRILGADSIVVGSFQKVQDVLRIQARIIEVETGQVRAPARVEGKDILRLQVDIATKLVEEMKGSLAQAEKQRLETLPSKNLDALRALSDGAYFLRNDLTQDALKEFDRAISLDPGFTEAHYYKGVALAKLKQWDDAVTSLKRTLPRLPTEPRIRWSWEAPFEPGSLRGLITGRDPSISISQLAASNPLEAFLRTIKRLIYTERSGKNTVLHFVDPAKRSSTRVLINDDRIPTTGNAAAGVAMTVITAATPASLRAGQASVYAVGRGGDVLWRTDLKTTLLDVDLVGQTLLEFLLDGDYRIVALDAMTLTPSRLRIRSSNRENCG